MARRLDFSRWVTASTPLGFTPRRGDVCGLDLWVNASAPQLDWQETPSAEPGSFDRWMANMTLDVISPLSGNTGTFERWLVGSDALLQWAGTVTAEGATVPPLALYYRRRMG